MVMTTCIANTLRKPISDYDSTFNNTEQLNAEQRKVVLDKAISDLIQEIVKIRNVYLKV